MSLSKTLPGSIPGLLRPGSPVLWKGEPSIVVPTRSPTSSSTRFLVYCAGQNRVDVAYPKDTVLDIDDTTGFLHAKEWLWRACTTHPAGPQLHWLNAGSGRWFLSNPEAALAFDIATLDPTEALRLACLQKAGL